VHRKISFYMLTVHYKGVWGRLSPTIGGCSANEESAEGGACPPSGSAESTSVITIRIKLTEH